MKGEEEEEEARPRRSPVPRRPSSFTGRDLGPSEPAPCAAALGQSRRAWNCDTREVAGSNPPPRRLKAR